MRATGIVRKLDAIGRVGIPLKLRRTLEIGENAALEILTDRDRIILRKYRPSCICIFCGSKHAVTKFKGKNVCNECLSSLIKTIH